VYNYAYMELIALLPLWYQYTLVILLGLVIGSFLNVYIYRFHTGRSLAGSSHCLSCAQPLAWYELLPVFSYLALRGRCRTCGSYIPFRYVLVELLTAGLFILAFSLVPLSMVLILWWLLLAVLVVIVVYDLYHLIIPNELVVAVAVVATSMLLWSLVGQPFFLDLLIHAAAALGAFAFYGGLWLVSRGRWIGLGDAKLAVPLAFFLGPWATFSFVVLSFWIGAGLSVLLLLVQRILKRGQHRLSKYGLTITMKSEVPFAPFLVLAFLVVALCKLNVLTFFTLLYV
jgi:leader peptidase (prepilin peptidase) / N-methyltransferase